MKRQREATLGWEMPILSVVARLYLSTLHDLFKNRSQSQSRQNRYLCTYSLGCRHYTAGVKSQSRGPFIVGANTVELDHTFEQANSLHIFSLLTIWPKQHASCGNGPWIVVRLLHATPPECFAMVHCYCSTGKQCHASDMMYALWERNVGGAKAHDGALAQVWLPRALRLAWLPKACCSYSATTWESRKDIHSGFE